MELTKLLLNSLSASSDNLKRNTEVKQSENKFESYLNGSSSNKEKNKISSKNDKYNNVSKTNNDKNYSDKKIVKKADSETDKAVNAKEQKKESITDDKVKTEDSKKTQISEETENIISEKEIELQEEIAKILGIDVDEVKNVLEQLGVNVFELENPENLLSFLQEVFQAEVPSDLLAIDGIKDTMVQIKQMVEEKTTDFENLLNDLDLDFETLRQIKDNINESETPVLKEDGSDIASDNEEVSSMEQNAVKQGAVKDSDVSFKEKKETNALDYSETDNIQTETAAAVESSENTSMKNDFTGQNSFQNNMNFENNGSNNNNTNGLNAVTFENINKALSQVAAKTQTMRNVNTADVINQIIDKFKVGIVKENVSEIRVTLKPDYLGDVALKIVSENGIVSAQFTAENQRVKEIIESNFNNLKNMLDEQGVQVSALSVSVGGEDSENERRKFEFEQSKSSKRINNIINNSSDEEEEKIEYVDEGDVLQTSVNYTA